MDRRIFGIENEYGVTCTFQGQRRLSPDEVARYLFRQVVSWGRSSNVFLRNGARLYLDVGSHPEYATPECDDVVELVTHDKAGERILEGLLLDAEQRLHDEGIAGEIYLFKNNTDSAGNSYGCHENYLVGRAGEFSRLADVLIPFLVTRQIMVGRRQGPPDAARRVLLRLPARRAHLGGRLQRHHPLAADHQHPRRAARRRREVPPAARDRRRLQHERDHHDAQGRLLRPGAADDRGGRGDARPHDGEPDPRDPRDQPRRDRAAQGPARQRPRGHRPGDPGRVPQQGPRLRRPPRHQHADDRAGPRPVGARAQGGRVRRPRPGRPRDRLGHQVEADRALPRQARPAAGPPADRPARPGLPRHPPRPRASTTCSRSAARSRG